LFEPLDFAPQDIKVRFRLKKRLGGLVSSIASLLNLPRCPFRSSFVALRNGHYRHNRGTKRDNDRE
jgi:hypothetical protein